MPDIEMSLQAELTAANKRIAELKGAARELAEAFATFRVGLRDTFYRYGIRSNPGWSDDNFEDAIAQLGDGRNTEKARADAAEQQVAELQTFLVTQIGHYEIEAAKYDSKSYYTWAMNGRVWAFRYALARLDAAQEAAEILADPDLMAAEELRQQVEEARQVLEVIGQSRATQYVNGVPYCAYCNAAALSKGQPFAHKESCPISLANQALSRLDAEPKETTMDDLDGPLQPPEKKVWGTVKYKFNPKVGPPLSVEPVQPPISAAEPQTAMRPTDAYSGTSPRIKPYLDEVLTEDRDIWEALAEADKQPVPAASGPYRVGKGWAAGEGEFCIVHRVGIDYALAKCHTVADARRIADALNDVDTLRGLLGEVHDLAISAKSAIMLPAALEQRIRAELKE